MKKLYYYLVFITFILVINYTNIYAEDTSSDSDQNLTKAVIISEVTSGESTENEYTKVYRVEILEGKNKGTIVNAEYDSSYYATMNYEPPEIKINDKVLLYIERNEADEITNVYVAEMVRDKYLLYLTIFLIIALIAVGGFKGLKSILALIFTFFVIFKFILPMIIKGYDPVYVSVPICTAIIIITVFLVCGVNKKSFAAILGTSGGVIVAGLLVKITATIAKIQGIGSEESRMLAATPENMTIDFGGILFAGVIIGTLGAAIDVGISISSTMNEIKMVKPEIKKTELMKRGMNVGKDIMATMSNTLILAYLGGSMQLLLLYTAVDVNFSYIVNTDLMATEILRAVAGTIGLVFTIPLTAVFSGILSYNYFDSYSTIDEQINKYNSLTNKNTKKLELKIYLLHMILYNESITNKEYEFVENECLNLIDTQKPKNKDLMRIYELLVTLYDKLKNKEQKEVYLKKIREVY
jgi:uncharacterized membrane protein